MKPSKSGEPVGLTVDHEIRVLQGLLDATRDSFNQRRTHQWRINLVFWASIVTAAWALKDWNLSPALPQWAGVLACVAVFLGGVIIVAIFTSWSYHLWKANAWDKARATHYRNSLQLLVRHTDPFPETPRPPRGDLGTYRAWLQDWSQRHELWITFLLTLFAVGLIIVRWTRLV